MLKYLPIFLILMLSNSALASSQNKVEFVAGVIYAEALGQSDYAKGLVATTIWVRAKNNPKKLCKVCSIPKQFARPQKNNDPEWKACLVISKKMFSGKFKPVFIQRPNGVWVHPDHFYTSSYPKPFWARGKWYKKVGNFRFFQLGKFRSN